MHPRTQNEGDVTIAGLEARTDNIKESDPSTANIPGLWKRFMEEGWGGQIPSNRKRSLIYAVYSAYESDALGPYSLIVGLPVDPRVALSSRLTRVTIAPGEYLRFVAQGEMPGSLIEAWGSIWNYFNDPDAPERAFQTDFEIHDLEKPDRVEILVGVK